MLGGEIKNNCHFLCLDINIASWLMHVSDAWQQCLQDSLHYSEPNKRQGSAIIYLNLSADMSRGKHVLVPPPAPLTRD